MLPHSKNHFCIVGAFTNTSCRYKYPDPEQLAVGHINAHNMYTYYFVPCGEIRGTKATVQCSTTVPIMPSNIFYN